MAFQIDAMSVSPDTMTKGGGPHVSLFLIYALPSEIWSLESLHLFLTFFPIHSNVLPLGRKSSVLKISPEHLPGRSLVEHKN